MQPKFGHDEWVECITILVCDQFLVKNRKWKKEKESACKENKTTHAVKTTPHIN
jgi:hypothetical protein